jgi:methyl-accepting chemotaxis protein
MIFNGEFVNHISFARKIYFSILILMFIIFLNSLYTIIAINKTQNYSNETALFWLPSVNTSQDMKYTIAQIRRRELIISYSLSKKEIEENLKIIEDRLNSMQVSIKKYPSLITLAEEKKIFDEFNDKFNNYLKYRPKFVDFIKSSKTTEAHNYLLNNLDKPLQDSQDLLEKISDLNYKGSIKSTQNGEYLKNLTNISMFFIMTSSLFIIIAIILLVKKSTKSIIKEIDSIKFQSNSTSNIGNNLKQSSNKLSQSTELQTNSVHKTSAAIDQISSMINRTAENATSTLLVSKNASDKAKEGEKIMNHLEKAMETIEESSTQLQNIAVIITQINTKTAVINDIVAKTELLSLNASIESARAGEHGKGFAVVAEEVGNLAKVSGKAANEIQLLLQSSQTQVNTIIDTTKARVVDGKNVTLEAHAVFKAISENIVTVTSVIEQISDATKEQEIGIKLISNSMVEIEKSTQNSKGIVQLTEESSLKLVEQSKTLDETTNILEKLFKGKIHAIKQK